MIRNYTGSGGPAHSGARPGGPSNDEGTGGGPNNDDKGSGGSSQHTHQFNAAPPSGSGAQTQASSSPARYLWKQHSPGLRRMAPADRMPELQHLYR